MPELSTIQIFYTVLLATTFLTQGLIAAWVYRYQWDRSGTKWFLIMVGTGMIWVLPYTFFFVVTNSTYQHVAHGVGFFGALSTVCAFVVFASKYTEARFHHNRLIQAHLVAIIGGYLLLAPTNNMHHLLFADFRAVSEPFSYIAVQRGVVFWGMLLSLQIPGLYAYYRLVTHLRSSQRHGGGQLILFIVGALSINTLDYVDHLTTLLPMDGFPDALLGMFVFYLFVAVALFRFNLLDVKPVARKTVIESLHDPVLVIEEQNRVVDFNEAATAVWPALPHRLLDPFETACPEVEATIEAPLEGTFTTELTIERNEVERHYSVTASAVTADGAKTGWYSVVLREITERKEREQELEETKAELKQSNEKLNQFAGMVSHDLRNPLNVIRGRAELLRSEAPAEHVDPIRNNAERMETMIEDLLTLSRAGKSVDDPEEVSLARVVADSWAAVGSDGIELDLEVPDTVTVAADGDRLRHVFENLFRNASEHNDSPVRIRVGTLFDETESVSGFFIADDGTGIPESEREDVFEQGFTTNRDGTGFGLSIVEEIVEAHGWRISVGESDADGARFDVHMSDQN
jgi:signal transduction histidine kinase